MAEGASLAAWNYKNEAKIEKATRAVSLDLIQENAEANKLWAHGRVTADGEGFRVSEMTIIYEKIQLKILLDILPKAQPTSSILHRSPIRQLHCLKARRKFLFAFMTVNGLQRREWGLS